MIKIKITGPQGSGKSTIGNKIFLTLTADGKKEFNKDHPNEVLHLEVILNNVGIGVMNGKCSTRDALNAGLSARFEHGESGAT